jgi:hypothetical protein
LESLYAFKQGRLEVAAERSLTALKLAIHYYGNKNDRSWQLIWEKAYFAANVHYHSSKYDNSYALYDICKSLSDRIKTEELSSNDVNG